MNASIFNKKYVEKLSSANGGCLGSRSRRRSYEAAKSLGELPTELRSEDYRMGEPNGSQVPLFLSEYIGQIKETWGSETSQYPQEEKTTVIPLVVASESGRG